MTYSNNKIGLTVGALAFCGTWLSLSMGIPTIVAPGSLLSLIPGLITGVLLTSMSYGLPREIIYVLISGAPAAALSCTWTVFAVRHNRIPTKSVVLLTVATVLSVLYFLSHWDRGIEHQGFAHTITVAIENLAFALFCLGALIYNRQRGSRASNALFHALLFFWLPWASYPYFGELL